jgi:phosphatidylserine decarboxylase
MVKMSQDPNVYINFGPWPAVTPDQYQPAVADLYKLVNCTPRMANDLTEAIQNAYNATTPPILEVSNIQSLQDFYNFLQALVTWVPFEENTGTLVYNMLCLTYFIIDQDPITNYQSPLQAKAKPPYPELTPLSQWLVDLANNMGNFLSTPASLTDATLQTFYTAQNYNIDAYQVPQGGWLTFNDFFARKFLPGLRPIDQPNNTLVIVSAADSTFDGPTSNPPDPYDTTSWWPIEADGTVTFDAKGISWPISQLLNGSEHAATFNGGVFTHAFLGPADYHRQHSPITGTVIEQKIIPEQCYLQVIIVPTTDQKGNLVHRLKPGRPMNTGPKGPRHLLGGSLRAQEAPDSPGYQFCQTRGLFIIDSGDPKIGLVAVLPIGMCQVSSVVPSNDPQPFAPYRVTKGQEISYFQFGGSDIVLCFQSQANVEILADKGRHYSVGQQIGLFNSNTPSNPPKKN